LSLGTVARAKERDAKKEKVTGSESLEQRLALRGDMETRAEAPPVFLRAAFSPQDLGAQIPQPHCLVFTSRMVSVAEFLASQIFNLS
jgi:hypothetical protein